MISFRWCFSVYHGFSSLHHLPVLVIVGLIPALLQELVATGKHGSEGLVTAYATGSVPRFGAGHAARASLGLHTCWCRSIKHNTMASVYS